MISPAPLRLMVAEALADCTHLSLGCCRHCLMDLAQKIYFYGEAMGKFKERRDLVINGKCQSNSTSNERMQKFLEIENQIRALEKLWSETKNGEGVKILVSILREVSWLVREG